MNIITGGDEPPSIKPLLVLLFPLLLLGGINTPLEDKNGLEELSRANTGTFSICSDNTLIAVSSPDTLVNILGVKVNTDIDTKEVIEAVIWCESKGKHEGVWGDAGEYGISQFMPNTWNWFNELRGTNLDIYNREHQIKMTVWAFENGYQEHWTCYRLLDKGLK